MKALFIASLILAASFTMSCKKDKDTKKEDEPTSTSPKVSLASLQSTTYYIMDVDTTINLTANASDPNGSITKVKFYLNDELLEELTAAPYVVSYQFFSNETYKIKLVAYDNDGDSASATVTFGFMPAVSKPVVSFTFPGYNSLGVHGADTTLDIQVNAEDINGTVSKVKFYIDDVFLSEDLSAPYEASHTFVKGQSYKITAEAIDNDDNNTSMDHYLTITAPVFVSTGSFTYNSTTYEASSISCTHPSPNLYIIALTTSGDSYPSVSIKLTTNGTTGNVHCDSTSTATYGILNTASGAANTFNSYYSGYGDFNITTLTADRIIGTFSFFAKNAARTDSKSATGTFAIKLD